MNRRAISAVLIVALALLASAPRAEAMYQPGTGRFHTMDSHEGRSEDPRSLHKYLYAHADPVNNVDPSGHFTITEKLVSLSILAILISPNIANAPAPGDATFPDASGHMVLDGAIALAITPPLIYFGRFVIIPLRAKILGRPINPVGVVPYGFASYEGFGNAAARIRAAGATKDIVVGVRGSAATGVSSKGGGFRVNPTGSLPASDVDFFVISNELYAQGVAAGAVGKQGALGVGATKRFFPALHEVEKQLSEELGREATVRIFSESGFNAVRKGTEVIVP